ncbi:hypothetical protein G9A89_023456 [Geosiphon pyriformis]|nr:hypothetical protein G9A89_023456 [Geosiphon pyriformis]
MFILVEYLELQLELTKTVKLTKEDYSRLSMFFQLMGLVDVEIKPNNISSNPPKTTENFRKYRSSWTNNEDDLLRQGVRNFGVGNWVMISKLIGTKTNCHARRRWNVISAEKHGKWSKDEVDLLHHMVEKEGRKWSMISKLLKRTEGSVINRYVYDLKSARINRSWNEREKENFHKAYKSLGKDWVQISYAVGSKTPKQCSKYFFQNYQEYQLNLKEDMSTILKQNKCQKWNVLIGKIFVENGKTPPKNVSQEKLFSRSQLPSNTRVLTTENNIVTLDYSVNRLNVEVDKKNVVTKVCIDSGNPPLLASIATDMSIENDHGSEQFILESLEVLAKFESQDEIVINLDMKAKDLQEREDIVRQLFALQLCLWCEKYELFEMARRPLEKPPAPINKQKECKKYWAKSLKEDIQKFTFRNRMPISRLVGAKDNEQARKECLISAKEKLNLDSQKKLPLWQIMKKFFLKRSTIPKVAGSSSLIHPTYPSHPKNMQENQYYWSDEEKNSFSKAHHLIGKNQKNIPISIGTKKAKQFKGLLKSSQDSGLNRMSINSGSFSDKEMATFQAAFLKWGKNWLKISQSLGTRTPKQCYRYHLQNFKNMKF